MSESKRRLKQKARRVRGRYVAIDHWEMALPAWREMSPKARCALIELRRRFNGSNNGEINLSARDLAAQLGCAKDTANKALREVEEKGWARPNEKGDFYGRIDVDGRKRPRATSWTLTSEPFGQDRPTKDYARWPHEK